MYIKYIFEKHNLNMPLQERINSLENEQKWLKNKPFPLNVKSKYSDYSHLNKNHVWKHSDVSYLCFLALS